MLQADVALADFIKVQAEFSSQMAEMQTVIADQARQIDSLTKHVVKQALDLGRLTDNVARLEAELQYSVHVLNTYCNH